MSALSEAEIELLANAVRTGSEAIEQRDRETLEELIRTRWHEDCEWIPLIADVEGESSYRGHKGILTFYEDLWSSFEVRYGEPDIRGVNGAIVYLTSMELRGRESGVEVVIELGVVWEPDGDRIRRGRAFDSHAAALSAAGELDA